ncbi:Protein kinase domain [Macleaya cordata]|uniref:non-specific serine/threonine protein kinase n=1 Tax=Macleaya cordata TaxID=56857 RepID=A0A200QMQ0_MACCD|nr:Protein kinase domain [Macleaya cordata]
MKHLLRKLHIGGSVNEQQNRLNETTQNSSNNNRITETVHADNSIDYNFFEEEFQVQLAMAISASDPEVREDRESAQIKAAKQMSLFCPSSIATNETLAEDISLRYWNYNVVNYDERVSDGFYDVYGVTSNSLMQGKMPLLVDLQATSVSDNVDYEVVLVNRTADPALQQLERCADSLVLECRASELGPVVSGLLQKIANLVVDSMGGPVGNADEMLRRWAIRSNELRSSLNTIILPIGSLDVGLSRHRALLFKVLADRINLPCRLVKGSYYTGTDDGAVNLIKIGYDSEYIIDLMGAPGVLIPAEIPSNHFQNFGVDLMSSVTIEQTDKDSCFPLDKINNQSEKNFETLQVYSSDFDLARKDGSGSNEASCLGIQSKGDDVKLVQKNQTERFEHDFGKLLPSLHRSHEGTSGISGKSSPAQKLQVKDVSKCVISAAQNPDFAQKLHALLLESCAVPPPDILADLAPPQDLGEQNVLVQSCSLFGENMDKESRQQHLKFPSGFEHSLVPSRAVELFNQEMYENNKNHYSQWMVEKQKEDANAYSKLKFDEQLPDSLSTAKLGFGRSGLHFGGETNVTRQGFFPPLVHTSEGFMLVHNGLSETNLEDSMAVCMGPAVNSSALISKVSSEEQAHESPMLQAADVCQRQLEKPLTDGGQCSQGNAGRIANPQTKGTICFEEYQQTIEGSKEMLVEKTKNASQIARNLHNEWINSMLDEVAEWEIPWEDIQIGERIGIGSYGEVYHADWNGTEVAVKKFFEQDFSGDALEQLRCEVRIMLRLRHPNVVLFMGAVTRPPNLSILTEFLPRGSLCKLLHRPNIQLDEKRRLRMALDVAKGMNYLHTSHPTIVHRDLKSPNLLVDKNWVVKVCDFGLSRLKHNTFLSSKSMAGTPEWMAPEVLRNEPSNEKCDVYSFGVILWELATLRMPWSGMNPMQVVGAVGFQNRRLEIPEEVEPMVASIIRDCWQSDPDLRPSFSQLMSLLKPLKRLVVEKT